MNTLPELITSTCTTDPDHPLYIFDDKVIRAREIWDSVCRLTNGLRALGIEKGSRVLLMLPNIPEYVIAYYAILSAGAVVVPVNPMLRERELRYLMEDCEARAIIAGENNTADAVAAARSLVIMRNIIIYGNQITQEVVSLGQLIDQQNPETNIAECCSEDTAVILYTAGTTGRPKGAELSHRSLIGNAQACRNLLKIRAKDRLSGLVPFFCAFGQTAVMNTALAAGATVVLLPDFVPGKTVRAVKEHKISIFLATPSVYSVILTHPRTEDADFSSVRYCISGGSALKADLLQEFEEKFSVEILEGYGLCETTAVATFNHPHLGRKSGSIGTPIEGVEIKILDDSGKEVSMGEVGDIHIRSEFLMKGYLNRPEATAAVMKDGWFTTGDLAYCDETGYITIVDRKTDMIVKGGFNVYPAEIEEVLLAHPGIIEAAVIGVPDPVQGEEIKACIVLKDECTITAEKLAGYCRDKMARYKCPRYIQFYQQLPKSPTGRILKNKLRNNG